MKTAAIYARVSSDKQKEENTIASQTAALTAFAAEQGYAVPTEWIVEDEGYSGASLIRPGLERVRDLAAEGELDAVLVYAPDRLSRRYAYQILLIEELARAGVETLFIRSPRATTAEDQLLLQFQGMIAEYERAQILERSRRGKRPACRSRPSRCPSIAASKPCRSWLPKGAAHEDRRAHQSAQHEPRGRQGRRAAQRSDDRAGRRSCNGFLSDAGNFRFAGCRARRRLLRSQASGTGVHAGVGLRRGELSDWIRTARGPRAEAADSDQRSILWSHFSRRCCPRPSASGRLERHDLWTAMGGLPDLHSVVRRGAVRVAHLGVA